MDETRLAQAIVDALRASEEQKRSAADDPAEKARIRAEEETKERANTIKSLIEFNKKLKEQNSTAQSLQRAMRGQTQDFVNVSEELEKLEKALEAASDALDDEQVALLNAEKAQLKANASLNNLNATFSHVNKTMGAVVNGLAAGAKAVVTNLQGGGSDIQMAADVLSAGFDAAGGAAKAVGSGLSSAGLAAAASTTSKSVKRLGISSIFAGEALALVGEKGSELAKFGISVLTKEVERTVKAFNETSAAGALFADGATGMRNAAFNAGLTTDQFAAVIKSNADSLALSGLSVGEGARKVGQVTDTMAKTIGSSGKNLRQELLALGYSVEEQAGLTAEVIGDLSRNRSALVGDNRAISKETAEYATNLRVIAAITGQDAKAKIEEQRKMQTQVAFRLKLQELEQKQPGITKKFQAAMATMDEAGKQAIMEQMTLGAVRDKAANVMMANSEAYNEKISRQIALLESGNFTTEEAQRIQGETNDKMQKDLVRFREIGVAQMAGSLQELDSGFRSQIDNMDRVTADSVAAGRANAEGQRSASDELTRNMVQLAEIMQKLRTDFQVMLSEPMKNFQKVATDITEALRQQLAKLGLVKETATGDLSKGGGTIGGFAGTAVGAYGGALKGAAVGSALGPIGTVAGLIGGAIVGGMLGKMTGEALGTEVGSLVKTGSSSIDPILGPDEVPTYTDVPMALGGIIKGPKRVLAGENPRFPYEAFVPLPDNKTIPVTVNFSQPTTESSGLISNPMSMLKDVLQSMTQPAAPSAAVDLAAGPAGTIDDTESTKRLFQTVFSIANEPLVNAVREQVALMRTQADKIEQLVSISAENKDISQQLLNNAY